MPAPDFVEARPSHSPCVLGPAFAGMTLVGGDRDPNTAVIPAPRVRDSALAEEGRDPCTSRSRRWIPADALRACGNDDTTVRWTA